MDERFDHYQNALTDIVEKATRQAVEYVRQFENPVIVLEDLSYIRERLDYGKFMNRRLHAWAFARLQGRIEDKATEEGIRVEYVNAAANIAGRVDPWGESVPWEPERDDSPQDGSACDSGTVHRETSEKSSQMTLAAYSD